MALFKIYNGATALTAKPVAVTTGTSIKTLLQVVPSATLGMRIVEWGISFDGSAAATPGSVELFESDVGATVTAHVAAGINKYDAAAVGGGDPTTNLIQVGTETSGYTASAEDTTTAARLFDAQLLPPTGPSDRSPATDSRFGE